MSSRVQWNGDAHYWSDGKHRLTCSLPTRRLSHPMCFNSPIIFDRARFASCRARCVLRAIAECSALNHAKASCESLARNIHEWMPSGECNSMHRFSGSRRVEEKRKSKNNFIENLWNIRWTRMVEAHFANCAHQLPTAEADKWCILFSACFWWRFIGKLVPLHSRKRISPVNGNTLNNNMKCGNNNSSLFFVSCSLFLFSRYINSKHAARLCEASFAWHNYLTTNGVTNERIGPRARAHDAILINYLNDERIK